MVIVTRNRRGTLLHTLDQLSAPEQSHRVLGVDNPSSEGTESAVRARAPQTTVISLSRNLGSAARTCGVLEASEPYIAFCDDDSWWGPGSLSRLDLAAAGRDLAYVPEIVAHHHPPPRSDPTGRRWRQARNALWFAWMRRPLSGALHETASVLRRGLSDRAVARGISDAVAGSGLVLRERRPVGPELERRLRQLDHSM